MDDRAAKLKALLIETQSVLGEAKPITPEDHKMLDSIVGNVVKAFDILMGKNGPDGSNQSVPS